MNIERTITRIKIVVILIVTIACMAVFLVDAKASNFSEKLKSDTIDYDLKVLSKRYGKKIAIDLVQGVVKYGYSKTMVYHAKGKPYLIEEPLGVMLDYEIYFYNDAVIFIEFGTVVGIKEIKKVETGFATK